MTKFTVPRDKCTRYSLLSAAALVVLIGLFWGGHELWLHRVMSKAEQQVGKGYAALAAETVECSRMQLTKRDRGCRLLIGIYYGLRDANKLAWASESCLDRGLETPENMVGLAASRELSGRDNEALNILNFTASKFKDSAEPVYRIAQMLRRLKNDGEATKAYLEATRRAPKAAQLSLEAMEYFVGQKKWPEARKMASQIRDVKTDNAEIKLMIARAFKNGGDPATADAVVSEARQMMAKQPALKTALEANYKDVLSGAKD